MNKPHKHAAVIKQRADGADVQFCSELCDDWCDTDAPVWLNENKYRVKPKKLVKLLDRFVVRAVGDRFDGYQVNDDLVIYVRNQPDILLVTLEAYE